MKKAIVVFTALIGAVIMSLLSGCCLLYSFESEKDFDVGISKKLNSCYIAHIKYTDSLDIVLPNDYEGVPIKYLGGYFGRGVPCPFCVEIDFMSIFQGANDYYIADKDFNFADYDELNITTLDFTITLPSGLEEIKLTESCLYVSVFNENDNVRLEVIKPTCYFIISEENKYFFTENGKLYDKKTDTLYTDFIYRGE